MLRVDSVEGLLGVRAPFAYPLCVPVLSHFFGTSACIILPPPARADASLLTSIAGEWASVKTRTRGSAFDRANTPLCYRGTPDIYVLTCVDALLVRG